MDENKIIYRPHGGWDRTQIFEDESSSNKIALKAVALLLAVAVGAIALPFYYLSGVGRIYRRIANED
jgi:hypothetical protein